MTLIVPQGLSAGDTVGIAAPSGCFDHEKFYRGVSVLKEMGIEVCIPDGIFKKKGYLAGDDYNRSETLNFLFRNSDIKGIMCARGGYGAMRILNLLDYEAMKNNPKFFMGFSDTTAILDIIVKKCGFVAYHGPVITSLGGSDGETVDSVRSALFAENKRAIAFSGTFVVREGSASGTVKGGNLATICHMAGTPYQPDFNGSLLVIEDINEPLYKVDRMLFQLKISGCFEGVKGVVLGEFCNCGDMDAISQLVAEVISDGDVPVMGGFPFGHGVRNFVFPYGSGAVLDSDGCSLVFD